MNLNIAIHIVINHILSNLNFNMLLTIDITKEDKTSRNKLNTVYLKKTQNTKNPIYKMEFEL